MTEDIETKARKLFENDRKFKGWTDCPSWERLHPSTRAHYLKWATLGKHPIFAEDEAS
jgi:hypothetical protein